MTDESNRITSNDDRWEENDLIIPIQWNCEIDSRQMMSDDRLDCMTKHNTYANTIRKKTPPLEKVK